MNLLLRVEVSTIKDKYLPKMADMLQKEYDLDVWWDLILVRNDRLVLFSDLDKDDDMLMEVVIGSLTYIGIDESPTVGMKDLLACFDHDNAFAEIGGKKEHFHDVRNQIYDIKNEPNVTFPIKNDKGRYWLRLHIVPLPERKNLVAIFITDVTRYLAAEEDIFLKSHQDALTGLFNKYTLDYHYGRRYKMADFHALYLDIDDFKILNDEKGHRIGDDFLRGFADILLSYEDEYNRFYRLGGDEFVGLFFADEEKVKTMAEEIMARVRSMSKERFDTETTVSIGIVQAEKRIDVLRKADKLMYRAKELGKDRYLFEKESNLSGD